MSLGWISKSGQLPSKRRDIEGVGSAGLVDLKAAVSRAEANAKEGVAGIKELRKARSRVVQNTGVEERAKRDFEEEFKMSEENYYERLKEKSALYSSLSREGAMDDSGEKYLVDFDQKSWDHEAQDLKGKDLVSADMMTFKERQRWESEAKKLLLSDDDAEEGRERRKRLLSEIEEETAKERERVKESKSKQESAVKKRLEALKKRKAEKKKEEK